MHLPPSIFEMKLAFKLPLCLAGSPLHTQVWPRLAKNQTLCNRSLTYSFISLDGKQLTTQESVKRGGMRLCCPLNITGWSWSRRLRPWEHLRRGASEAHRGAGCLLLARGKVAVDLQSRTGPEAAAIRPPISHMVWRGNWGLSSSQRDQGVLDANISKDFGNQ